MTIDSVTNEEDNPRLTENPSLPAGAACNGVTASATASTSNNNVNNIRKTLAKWLRLQKGQPSSQPRQTRYNLIGWPPKWVRRRTHSPAANRALPPVPSAAASQPEEEEDHERVRTPEMQPEDFPPGVAYLPEGEDDDPDVFESKSDIIDFAASIETVKNVRF